MTEETPPPPRRPVRRWPLAAFAVVLVVAGVVAALLLSGSSDERPTDPHGIAGAVAAAMAKPAPSDLGQYYCPDISEQDQHPEDVVYDPGDYRTGTEKRLADDLSFVQVLDKNDPNSRYAVYFVKRQNNWCVGAVLVCSKTADGGYLATIPMMCHEVYPDVPPY